jgi:hypothetical protein
MNSVLCYTLHYKTNGYVIVLATFSTQKTLSFHKCVPPADVQEFQQK